MGRENGIVERDRGRGIVAILKNPAEIIRGIGVEGMADAKLIAREAKISLGVIGQAFAIGAISQLIVERSLIDGIGIEAGGVGEKFSGIGEFPGIDRESRRAGPAPRRARHRSARAA